MCNYGDDCDDKNTAIKISSLSSQNRLEDSISTAGRKGTFDAKCQKCFCVTLAKSNRTSKVYLKENLTKGDKNETKYKCYGW